MGKEWSTMGLLGKKGNCDSCVVFLSAKLKQVSGGE